MQKMVDCYDQVAGGSCCIFTFALLTLHLELLQEKDP